MKGVTWFQKIVSLLWIIYVWMSALKSVESAYILERGDVVESDHAVVGVDVEWEMKRKGKTEEER